MVRRCLCSTNDPAQETCLPHSTGWGVDTPYWDGLIRPCTDTETQMVSRQQNGSVNNPSTRKGHPRSGAHECQQNLRKTFCNKKVEVKLNFSIVTYILDLFRSQRCGRRNSNKDNNVQTTAMPNKISKTVSIIWNFLAKETAERTTDLATTAEKTTIN